MKGALQSAAADPQQADRHGDIPRQPLESRRYLTARETVMYLGLPSLNALKQRMKRRTIPVWTWTRMGGSLRFLRVELDRWLSDRRETADAAGLIHGVSVGRTPTPWKSNSVVSKRVV